MEKYCLGEVFSLHYSGWIADWGLRASGIDEKVVRTVASTLLQE